MLDNGVLHLLVGLNADQYAAEMRGQLVAWISSRCQLLGDAPGVAIGREIQSQAMLEERPHACQYQQASGSSSTRAGTSMGRSVADHGAQHRKRRLPRRSWSVSELSSLPAASRSGADGVPGIRTSSAVLLCAGDGAWSSVTRALHRQARRATAAHVHVRGRCAGSPRTVVVYRIRSSLATAAPAAKAFQHAARRRR